MNESLALVAFELIETARPWTGFRIRPTCATMAPVSSTLWLFWRGVVHTRTIRDGYVSTAKGGRAVREC